MLFCIWLMINTWYSCDECPFVWPFVIREVSEWPDCTLWTRFCSSFWRINNIITAIYSAHIVAMTINIISIFKQNPKPSPAEGRQACCQAGSPRRPTERSRPFWIRVKSWITQHGMMYLFTMCNHQLLCFTVYIAEPAFDESNVFPTTVMFDLGWNLHPQTMCAAL